jgi:hypothetical protein
LHSQPVFPSLHSYDAVAAKIVEAIGADAIANGVDPKAVAE